MEIVVATHNDNKLNEIINFFKGLDINFKSMYDVGFNKEIKETGSTIEENALIKARTLKSITNNIIIADDTGLFVNYLNGKPGVFTARFAGENATYEDNIRKLLKMLEGVTEDKRTAYFKTVVVMIYNDKEFIMDGFVNGKITKSPRGINGFGYDPIFYVDELGKTFAELTIDEKNRVSHRAKALKKLKEFLIKNMEVFK